MKLPKILVIRPDDGFSIFLRESGFEVLNLELIVTEPVEYLADLTETINRIGIYDGIFLTSPVAAEMFLKRLNGNGFLGKVYVLGERSRRVLTSSLLNIRYSETANTVRDLISSFGEDEFSGKKLLYVRGDKTVGTIRQMLNDKAELDEIIVYRTIENRPDEAAVNDIKEGIKKSEIGWICFFSPSGVKSFKSNFGDDDLTTVKVAAIGETTAEAVSESGLNINFISPRAAAEDFAAGLAAYIKSIE